jgi:hypothetical protein
MGEKRRLSDGEREQRRAEDRERLKAAAEKLLTSEGWQRWARVRAQGGLARLSLNNQLLVALARPDATFVAGFKAWLKLGYCVRKGEKAIRTSGPIPPTRKQLAEWKPAGGDPNDKPRTRYRLGPVWDRSQVEPLPPPAKPVPLDPPITEPEGDSLAWAFPRLESLAGDLGCSLVIERHPDRRGGCLIPDLNLISLNEANSINHQIKTLVHELSYALLRRTDLDDLALTYSQEELVVESIALTVVGGLGLDTSGSSIPYLTSWSQNDDNLQIIETCAGIIDQLAKRIEDAIGHPPADPSPAAL